jgi:CubicO group peptidase (beta-lactamase class C family)
MARRPGARVTETELADLDAFYGGTMRPDVAVYTLAHTERLLPVRTVRAGPVASDLPRSARNLTDLQIDSGGVRYDLPDYLALNRVAGLLVLKDGAIVLEDYELGFGREHRWASASMAKSVTSTLVGVALAEGAIRSLEARVAALLPELAGSAYDGVTLKHLLWMCTGVAWDETYTDPHSDRRRLLAVQKTRSAGGVLAFMARRTRAAPPATVFNYNTGETYLLGLALERAVGEPLAEYLSRKIWLPAGMEREATWWLESENGAGLGGSGLSATLRDYARFGLLVSREARLAGAELVPAGWFDLAGAPQRLLAQRVDYGFQWWPVSAPAEAGGGAFAARGIYGQRLYVHRAAQLVVAVLCARSKPAEREIVVDDAFFAAVYRALA